MQRLELSESIIQSYIHNNSLAPSAYKYKTNNLVPAIFVSIIAEQLQID